MFKVSVIIPNYNHAPYLKQRIDSVLNQTYQDFEIIILDDCSSDNSRDIINGYLGHPKISQVIFNETNSGTTFKQWKKGIELARGKYIWIAESDDWCEPVLLETLVKGLEDNEQCVMAYAQTYLITNNNHIEKTSAHHKLSEYVNGKKYIAAYLAGSCSIWNVGMLIFKRECYFHISQQFTEFKMCGDWLFYIEIATQGDVFISGKLLNYFRGHQQNVSSEMYGSGNNYLEELKILKILKKWSLISRNEFKAHLLFKYVQFNVFKRKFKDDIQNEIKKSFFNDGDESFRQFLYINGELTLFRNKLKRRLNLLLS